MSSLPPCYVVTDELSLCWIHEGRHYKKLIPHLAYHRQLLDDFLQRYWDFYGQLESELRMFATNISIELWGPSPVVPKPLRPGK
jgi:hypothetical protein